MIIKRRFFLWFPHNSDEIIKISGTYMSLSYWRIIIAFAETKATCVYQVYTLAPNSSLIAYFNEKVENTLYFLVLFFMIIFRSLYFVIYTDNFKFKHTV